MAFSDGVFALAATLLLVSFATPVVGHDQESDLTSKLVRTMLPGQRPCSLSGCCFSCVISPGAQPRCTSLHAHVRRCRERGPGASATWSSPSNGSLMYPRTTAVGRGVRDDSAARLRWAGGLLPTVRRRRACGSGVGWGQAIPRRSL